MDRNHSCSNHTISSRYNIPNNPKLRLNEVTHSGMTKQFGSGFGAGEACTQAERAATATEAMAINLILIVKRSLNDRNSVDTICRLKSTMGRNDDCSSDLALRLGLQPIL